MEVEDKILMSTRDEISSLFHKQKGFLEEIGARLDSLTRKKVSVFDQE